MNKVIKWLIKHLIFLLDRKGDLLTYSFAKDDKTHYNIIAERYYDDRLEYGTQVNYYRDKAKMDEVEDGVARE